MRTCRLVPTALLLLGATGCGGGNIAPPDDEGTLALVIEAGDEQVGTVGQAVPSPLSVRVTAAGAPRAGVHIAFAVQSGDAAVSSPESVTDDAGIASTTVVLGEHVGQIVVRATGEELEGSSVTFHLTSMPDAPAAMILLTGGGQLGFVGREFRDSVRVRVTDRFGNAAAGVAVTWEVREGGGTSSPAGTTTNGSGEVTASWTTGPQRGRNVLAASAGSAPTLEVIGTAVVAGPGRIAVSGWGLPVGGIHFMHPDGSDFRRMPNAGRGDRNPVWSRDGSRLAFNTLRFGEVEVAVMRADGEELVRVTPMPEGSYAEVCGWSPDGSEILFVSDVDRPDGSKIYVANADGTGTRRAIPNTDDGGGAAWSPDGRRIVFGRNDAIYLINPDGTGLRRLGDGESPRWSPDGSRIAFNSYAPGGGFQPMIMNADGSGVGPFPGIAVGTGGPRGFQGWSPDGTKVLLTGNGGEDDDFWSMNVDGTDLIQITYDEMYTLGGAWGPLPD